LMVIGYAAWFDAEFTADPSLQRPALKRRGRHARQEHRVREWWRNAVTADDQLRQRVAFALSELFVISDHNADVEDFAIGTAGYYDLLVRNALGNYRQLLEEVTLSPLMGVYLSHLSNAKADPATNQRPDENYAREVLQLFSIGLVKLNPDGAPMLDAQGATIPTYDQSVVEGFARVFTGWTYAGASSFEYPERNDQPMEPFEEFHEPGTKELLDGYVVPAGQNARQDLAEALDVIFQHPNVGPFVGRQLIQRLVTSNPSPDYIARVAAVFADDGTGVRGDLGAVVRAILTDQEARDGWTLDPTRFGKLREPLLRQTHLWRAFDAKPLNGKWNDDYPEYAFAQAPLRSPSVFNFFQPGYQPPGTLLAAGLFAPEFQISTELFVTRTTNRMNDLVMDDYRGNPYGGNIRIDIRGKKALAADPAALVDHLDLLLMGQTMSADMRDILIRELQAIALDDGTQRALDAIYLIVTSPEFVVQK